MKRYFLSLFVNCAFLLIPALIFAQQRPAGVVTALQGQVQLTRATSQISLHFKDGVLVRDIIDTREKSLVRILFGGRSTVTVRELSRFEVREETLPTGARRDVHELSSGAILVHVARSLMRPGDEVQIRTPNAVASVRGTTIFAQYDSETNQSFFALLSGTVLVIPEGQLPLTLTPNLGIHITGSGPKVQAVQVTVPQTRANEILHESRVKPAKKDEANRQQTAQAQIRQAARLAATAQEIIRGSASTREASIRTEPFVEETKSASTEPTHTPKGSATMVTATPIKERTVTRAPLTAGGKGKNLRDAVTQIPKK